MAVAVEGGKSYERISEAVITTEFDLAQAVSDLRFYFELAKKRGESVTVELWTEKGRVVPAQGDFLATAKRR